MKIEKFIKIVKDRIYLTPEMWVHISDTSLKGTDLTFKSEKDIYLKVKIIGQNVLEGAIKFEVIDYFPKNTDEFVRQFPRRKVTYILFQPLIWNRIEPHLSIYTKNRLLRDEIIYEDGSSFVYNRGIDPTEAARARKATGFSTYSYNHIPQIKREPFIETLNESAEINFEDAEFKQGLVTFTYKSKELNSTFNLEIENKFILEEFNAIKAYFSKALGRKKRFSIDIVFTLTDKVVTAIATKSPEIEAIDEKLIERIKHARIANLTSTPLSKAVDRSLFTSVDIFDSFDKNLKEGNIFGQSEQDILHHLIKTRDIRNATHLQYLSGSLQSVKQKLRFTLKPLFGFLFVIEGETKNHYCWELLDSHATYLWSFDKTITNFNTQIKKVEEIINVIKEIGRDTYKGNFKNNPIEDNVTFCAIEHSKDGFPTWQLRLQQKLL